MRFTTRRIHALSFALAVLAVSFLVLRATDAAFFSVTSNGTNNVSSATVELTDDDAGSVMFDLSDPDGPGGTVDASSLVPGSTITNCIEVTYAGDVPADVRLYGTDDDATGVLEDFLELTVERGTGGTFGDCAGFTLDTVVFDSTTGASAADGDGTDGELSDFLAGHTDFASGADSWDTAADGTVFTYRFTMVLEDDNSAQNENAAVTFSWQAENQ